MHKTDAELAAEKAKAKAAAKAKADRAEARADAEDDADKALTTTEARIKARAEARAEASAEAAEKREDAKAAADEALETELSDAEAQMREDGVMTESEIKANLKERRAVAKTRPVEVDVPEGIYEGTVRVVTEADVLGDPRLVAAAAVVGQLYDFSNLPDVKDGQIEADIEARNEAKAKAGVTEEAGTPAPAVPQFTSENERIKLGIEDAPNAPVKVVR